MKQFQPQDTGFEDRVRASFARQRAPRLIATMTGTLMAVYGREGVMQ